MTRQHPNTVSSALIPPKRFIRVAPLGIEYNNNLTCQGAIYKAVPHSHTVPMSVFSGSMPSPQSHIPRGTRNEQQLTRELLIVILNDFSARLLKVFGRPIQLVVHGGAVMVLHPTLAASTNRRTTRDIDFIKRSFLVEMHKSGIYDAEAKLQRCIDATAMKFQLGTDWFNADADIALPMAKTPQGQHYDPIYYDSLKPNNVALNTIYVSKGLRLISVTMFWGVALKMVRYKKDDPEDILAMLRHGTKLNGVQWTPQVLEGWLLKHCWPMGYSQYPSWKIEQMRDRFTHAVEMVQGANQRRTPTRHTHYH